MPEMVAAYVKGDVEHAREVNARLIPSWEFETRRPHPQPPPDQGHVCGRSACPPASAGCPLGPAPEGLDGRARAAPRAPLGITGG